MSLDDLKKKRKFERGGVGMLSLDMLLIIMAGIIVFIVGHET
jgi:hypothetical protein